LSARIDTGRIKNLEYYSPDNLAEAYRILATHGEDAVPIAGGSFFMGHREELFDEVAAVVNIKRLGLSYIRSDGNVLCIGATTTLAELERADEMRHGPFAIFAETVRELNIVEVRNVATIGGEVCIAGEVDMPTTLLAYDAQVVIGSSEGQRKLSMEDFHIGYLNTALKPGEMVIEVRVPRPPTGTCGGFAKFERTAADLPIVNVASRVTLDPAGVCREARVAVGAATVAGVPRRSVAAEAVLVGKRLDQQLIRDAASATADIECINDFRASAELRSHWVACGTEDALTLAMGKSEQGS
jgi:carbon-monoxide dehydrogenase medium subunit